MKTYSRRTVLFHSALSVAAGQATRPRYDILVRGGYVICPAQNLSAVRDVAVLNGRIARVSEGIAPAEAAQVIDARGYLVTPGLIDIHVHVYDGVAPLGIPADPNCIAKGVTTVVDAGSAGAHTFPGLRKYVINVVDTRVYALLNISVVGQSTLSTDNPWGELIDLRLANAKLTAKTIEQNRDVIVGVKIRLTENIAGRRDLDALKLAREAADAVRLPLMVHIGGTFSTLPKILELLRKGDVITHSFRGGAGGILDDRGRVLPEVLRSVRNGVNLDIGHGAGSFAWATAEAALKQDLLPGTISSDVHQFNVHGPVLDLATTLSKFVHLGMKLEDVLTRATVNPARTFGALSGFGTLREGSTGDIAVFRMLEGDFELSDSLRQRRVVHQRLLPVAAIKAGRLYGASAIPVVTL
ncbi:MAG: amidohydrolase/deacetylase family metallohydrolase [Bryobacteraceae bacterium]